MKLVVRLWPLVLLARLLLSAAGAGVLPGPWPASLADRLSADLVHEPAQRGQQQGQQSVLQVDDMRASTASAASSAHASPATDRKGCFVTYMYAGSSAYNSSKKQPWTQNKGTMSHVG